MTKMSKGVVRIYYNTWGNAHFENRLWIADYPEGDVDYHQKEVLKRNAVAEGYDYIVERHHRNGQVSVMETNQ